MGRRQVSYPPEFREEAVAPFEVELLDRYTFIDRGAARRAIFDYIEGWYNPHRRHSALGYISPAEFERRWQARLEVA